MKTLSFYNEKGGTGKTTLTALFCSWLAYQEKEPVIALDLDFPSFQLDAMRQNDIKVYSELAKTSPLSPVVRLCQENEPFRLGKINEKNSMFTQADLASIGRTLTQMREQPGYLLLDFPGRYFGGDAQGQGEDAISFLSRNGLIDLVVFPIDSDRQSIASALEISHRIRKAAQEAGRTQEVLFLWNREAQKERKGSRDWYSDSEKVFAKMGIPVVGDRIHDVLIARRDIGTFGFIRNTLCWPRQNVAKACSNIENIFREVRARLDGTWTEEMRKEIYGEK